MQVFILIWKFLSLLLIDSSPRGCRFRVAKWSGKSNRDPWEGQLKLVCLCEQLPGAMGWRCWRERGSEDKVMSKWEHSPSAAVLLALYEGYMKLKLNSAWLVPHRKVPKMALEVTLFSCGLDNQAAQKFWHCLPVPTIIPVRTKWFNYQAHRETGSYRWAHVRPPCLGAK